MINKTNYKHIEKLLIKYNKNYTIGTYKTNEERAEDRRNQDKARRKEDARVYLEDLQNITHKNTKNAQLIINYLIDCFNIKELAPHNPHATDEQIILTLCYVIIMLEHGLIRDVYKTTPWKTYKLNYNIYNDVLITYYNFRFHDKRGRVAPFDRTLRETYELD